MFAALGKTADMQHDMTFGTANLPQKNRGKRHFVKKGLSKVFVDVNFWNLFLSERNKKMSLEAADFRGKGAVQGNFCCITAERHR